MKQPDWKQQKDEYQTVVDDSVTMWQHSFSLIEEVQQWMNDAWGSASLLRSNAPEPMLENVETLDKHKTAEI